MAFCPNCGTPLDGVVAPAVQPESEAVILARIDKERAIEVARIEAGAARAELRTAETIAETQAEAEVESAVATAEVIAATMDEPEPEPEEPPEPVIVEAPAPEPEEDNAPPVVTSREPRESKRGFWDAYR